MVVVVTVETLLSSVSSKMPAPPSLATFPLTVLLLRLVFPSSSQMPAKSYALLFVIESLANVSVRPKASMNMPPPKGSADSACPFPVMVELVTSQVPSSTEIPAPNSSLVLIVLSLIVELSMSTVRLGSLPSPLVLNARIPPPSPSLALLAVTVVPWSVRLEVALVLAFSMAMPPPDSSSFPCDELLLIVSSVRVADPLAESSIPPPVTDAVLSVTVELDRLSVPQSRMPPPLLPTPSSIVTPDTTAVVPLSILSTRVLTEHDSVHVACRTVVLWPPPLMVTVCVLSLTSSCPFGESTLYA